MVKCFINMITKKYNLKIYSHKETHFQIKDVIGSYHLFLMLGFLNGPLLPSLFHLLNFSLQYENVDMSSAMCREMLNS